jgi:hypothetical protein
MAKTRTIDGHVSATTGRGKKTRPDLVQHTRESYRNSLVDLSDRVGDMEEANSEIYRILKDLDEELNPKDLGVNAGLGVLTGDQALGKIEESTD